MSNKSNFSSKLKEKVIDLGLCTRCGSCVGVCPHDSLEFSDQLGECLPELTSGDCPECEETYCLEGCSGHEVDFPSINKTIFGSEPENYLYGHTKQFYVGHTLDEQIRSGSASGGIITSSLLFLLETKRVKGALVVKMKQNEPWKSESIIAQNKAELIEAQQSKYSLSPHNVLLRELQGKEGPFAYVGLPCQVHSVRKLQQKGHPEALKIKYIFGSFCGNMLYFDAIKSFLRSNGINDYKKIKTLSYRAGEWPGYLKVELKDGRIFSLHKFYANYLTPFYIVDRCQTCIDLTNEFADISCGDAWSPVYEERRKGWSLVCTRTETGQKLINELVDKKVIEMDEISYETAVDMHCHTLDIKKRGAFIRMVFRKKLGFKNPEYGIVPTKISILRYIFEIFLDSLMLLGHTRIARWSVEQLPLRLVGEVINTVKVFWKKITRSTRKKGITKIEFRKVKNI